jgi:hypothetical protein
MQQRSEVLDRSIAKPDLKRVRSMAGETFTAKRESSGKRTSARLRR